MSDSTGRKRSYPHGTAIDPEQVKGDVASDPSQMPDMFVTMCFYARLGFVQPPSCLKCAYRSSGCGSKTENIDENKDCGELVPWRRDANISLHPDRLEGNIVFVTCSTAKSLVNGDAYPSIRWDTRNRRLLHEI